MFEPMPITAQTRATAQEIAAALAPHADENIFEEQAVAAAPGRPAADAKGQAPATVIGEAEIRLSGAATVPELLRRLPGIEGIDASTLEIRGFNRRASSKVLLLVDGRSGFQDVFGGIPLVDLPLADVARIEVVRGTGAAFLGSAPYAAVVNVITKNGPEDAAGGRTGGEGATTQGVVAAGAKNAK
jgi:iron complex outermembrane receptor protein